MYGGFGPSPNCEEKIENEKTTSINLNQNSILEDLSSIIINKHQKPNYSIKSQGLTSIYN